MTMDQVKELLDKWAENGFSQLFIMNIWEEDEGTQATCVFFGDFDKEELKTAFNALVETDKKGEALGILRRAHS